MGHLNSFSASGGGNLDKNISKIQMPEGLPGGMFKLRFHWYITDRKGECNILCLALSNRTRFFDTTCFSQASLFNGHTTEICVLVKRETCKRKARI